MSKPVSPRPLRKVAAVCAYSHDDPLLRNPIIGIAVCCARAASGYATAAPPSSSMNWRRFGRSWQIRSQMLVQVRGIPIRTIAPEHRLGLAA